ncbi:glycosyltransferase family 4 protein [Sphingobacterium paucimobilis]|uniref:Uncharacterized protein n=1 Tax=Sphingobacterium paucimobilis HER1398 TaxID=1346330 RepID=U2HR08_9SPHI|nr:glycosyltransferase family 4 protein [Sphingobacterium paucimobilis]ERJ57720.1 hypothetical protein M472_02970 [Sphingobacterium paucimobilis HER1398]
MRILIIDDGYPSEENLYGDVFAHVRVKEYLKYFDEVLVAANITSPREDYTYEGVEVKAVNSIDGLKKLINEYNPDKILIHFATYPIIREIIFCFNKPYIIWVHGYEALSWRRRLFNFDKKLAFLKYIKNNVIQLYFFKKLIKFSNNIENNVRFVFVSNWMKEIAEKDCGIKVVNYNIIPNPINDILFYPVEKAAIERFNFLMIRPFYSKKYATDLVYEAVKLIQHKPYFSELNFTIVGKGALDSDFNKDFGHLPNVSISEGFLRQDLIKSLHDKHGVFLSLTRQDAQGVSMCEAMCSGLVTVSSNNTAIPEFITHNESGLLTNNSPEEIAQVIDWIYENPKDFQRLSRQGALKIIEIAGIKSVIDREVKLIEYRQNV